MAVSLTSSGLVMPATKSASADANTFDDYEEGSWTPVYGSNSTDPSYSVTQYAKYTLLGRIYEMWWASTISSASGGGTLSALYASSFPFTPKSETLISYVYGGYMIARPVHSDSGLCKGNNLNPANAGRYYFSDMAAGGGAALADGNYGGYLTLFLSDCRLKNNIVLLQKSTSILPNIYTFKYKWDKFTTYIGVMAQELLDTGYSSAVHKDSNGFYSVDYSKFRLPFGKI